LGEGRRFKKVLERDSAEEEGKAKVHCLRGSRIRPSKTEEKGKGGKSGGKPRDSEEIFAKITTDNATSLGMQVFLYQQLKTYDQRERWRGGHV